MCTTQCGLEQAAVSCSSSDRTRMVFSLIQHVDFSLEPVYFYMLDVIFHLSYLTVCQVLTASATVMRVNVSATTAGAVASYECVVGYTLVGFSSRTCQNNGSWSGSEPTCISKLLIVFLYKTHFL